MTDDWMLFVNLAEDVAESGRNVERNMNRGVPKTPDKIEEYRQDVAEFRATVEEMMKFAFEKEDLFFGELPGDREHGHRGSKEKSDFFDVRGKGMDEFHDACLMAVISELFSGKDGNGQIAVAREWLNKDDWPYTKAQKQSALMKSEDVSGDAKVLIRTKF